MIDTPWLQQLTMVQVRPEVQNQLLTARNFFASLHEHLFPIGTAEISAVAK